MGRTGERETGRMGDGEKEKRRMGDRAMRRMGEINQDESVDDKEKNI